MKLSRTLSLLVIALGAAGLTAAQGCGSSDSGTSGGTSTTAGRTPPPSPAGAAPSVTEARTFALNQIFLGETDRNGAALKDAWKDYGFNIDGLITTKTDTNVCQRQSGADSARQEDGKEGIDNAFGHTILGFILGLVSNPSKSINDSIAGGGFTVILDITGLTDDPKQTNTGLGGRLLIGGNYGDAPDGGTKPRPTFAPTDDWPYRASPVVPIEGAYINNGTFVNGAGGAVVQLSIYIQGVSLSLTINRASITFDHKPPNDIMNGTISGVVNTEALVSGIEKVAGRITTQLCGGSTLDTIKQTIRQASDILDDGTNVKDVPCNAISIGLGFTGKRIGAPKTLAKDGTVPADPCAADGGT